MAKDKNIVRFSAAELAEQRVHAPTKTDFARVRAKSEAELERDIANDPDFSNEPADWYERAEAMVPAQKKSLSIRLDGDVLEWFKSRGPGYQTRINAVLRAFVQQAKP